MIDEVGLRKKGWSSEEIEQTKNILSHSEAQGERAQILLYWFIMFVMVVITLLISMWLIPFFMVLKGWVVFLLLFLIGLSFGAMFNNLLIHLEHLQKRHLVFAGLIIPIVAIASLFLIVRAAAYTSALLNTGITQNPVEVSLFYVVGFLLPYVHGLLYRKKQ